MRTIIRASIVLQFWALVTIIAITITQSQRYTEVLDRRSRRAGCCRGRGWHRPRRPINKGRKSTHQECSKECDKDRSCTGYDFNRRHGCWIFFHRQSDFVAGCFGDAHCFIKTEKDKRSDLRASKHQKPAAKPAKRKTRRLPVRPRACKKPMLRRDERNGGVDAGSTVNIVDEWRSGTYFYSRESRRCAKGTMIGKVTVSDNFCIDFSLYIGNVNSRPGQWKSILHIGSRNYGHYSRQPGVWIYPRRAWMAFRFGDLAGYNRDYDPHVVLRSKTRYRVRFCMFDGEGTMSVDNVIRKRIKGRVPYTVYRAPIWVSDPWYTAADATVSELEIWSPTSKRETLTAKICSKYI